MDRTFDWQSRHDPRSRDFPIRATIGRVTRRSRWWASPRQMIDQGEEGACVGFGWTNEALASPGRVKIGDGTTEAAETFARQLYRAAQRIDEWEGEAYEGTSVLAGAKLLDTAGIIKGYRWAFSIDDVIDALCAPATDGGGPVVVGIPWTDTMYQTRPGGLVEVDGRLVGGHCIVLTGYHTGIRIPEEGWTTRIEVIRWRNSWGPSYGKRGDGFIRPEHLERLLKEDGEACIPQHRATMHIDGVLST